MIRWLCKNCNWRWIHPVEVCINCNSKTERQFSTKYTIAGFTEITVPSTLHPRVPYTVLLLKDEHGNLMPKKTMKKLTNADIGSDFLFEKGDVAIVKVKYDYYAAVLTAINLLENIDLEKKAMINADLIDDKKDSIEKRSQIKLIEAIKEVFDEGDELVVNVPFLRIDQERKINPESASKECLIIANAILAPLKDEPTHMNIIIASKDGNKIKEVFNALIGKGTYNGKVAGDELEANIRLV